MPTIVSQINGDAQRDLSRLLSNAHVDDTDSGTMVHSAFVPGALGITEDMLPDPHVNELEYMSRAYLDATLSHLLGGQNADPDHRARRSVVGGKSVQTLNVGNIPGDGVKYDMNNTRLPGLEGARGSQRTMVF